MIRPAERKDVPTIIELGEVFGRETFSAHGFEVSRLRIMEFVNTVIGAPEWVNLVSEDRDGHVEGMIMGFVSGIFFSESVVLQELVWYCKSKRAALELFYEFERVGKARGVTHVVVGEKPSYHDLERFYTACGYQMLEQHYAKEV